MESVFLGGRQAEMVELGGLALVVVFILAPVQNYYVEEKNSIKERWKC